MSDREFALLEQYQKIDAQLRAAQRVATPDFWEIAVLKTRQAWLRQSLKGAAQERMLVLV